MDNRIQIPTGTKVEIIDGQEVTVITYMLVDLDPTLDYNKLINEVMSPDPEKNAAAKEAIRLHQKMTALAKKIGESDGE